MKNFLLILLCALSAGCMTYAECSWHKEAEVVQTTWQEEFGDVLTESQEQCLHAFFVTHTSNMGLRCGSSRAIGCTKQRIHSDAAAHIFIAEGLTPELETVTLRHELTHRLTHCVLREEYENHQHEVFAFSGQVDWPESLAAISSRYEDSVNFVCE